MQDIYKESAAGTVHQELYEGINQECTRMTEYQIGKVKNDMKQLKCSNNINFLELQLYVSVTIYSGCGSYIVR